MENKALVEFFRGISEKKSYNFDQNRLVKIYLSSTLTGTFKRSYTVKNFVYFMFTV